MVTKTQGVQQAYNGQIIVDASEGVIVAATLSAHPNDMKELIPTVDAVVETTERQFEQLTADAGYFSADNVTAMEQDHIDAYIAAGAHQWRKVSGQTLFGKGPFLYNAGTDSYRCPADQVISFQRTRTESVGGGEVRTVHEYKGNRATCGACPLKDQCLSPKQSVKKITRGPNDDLRDAMKTTCGRPKTTPCIARARPGRTRLRHYQRNPGVSSV